MSFPLQFALTFPVLFDPEPARRHPRRFWAAGSLYDRYLQAKLRAPPAVSAKMRRKRFSPNRMGRPLLRVRYALSAKMRPAVAPGVALQPCTPGFRFGLTGTLVDAKLQEAQGSVRGLLLRDPASLVGLVAKREAITVATEVLSLRALLPGQFNRVIS